MKTIIALVWLVLFFPFAFAEEGWKNEKGQLVPNTDSRKAIEDFGGWLLVTPDADWKAKWETPSDTVPQFNEAKTVLKGGRIFILTFFSNPLLDDEKKADVTCDLDVIRPNGTSSIHQPGAVCFVGKILEDPHHLFLSAPILGFVGEQDDPKGVWVVRVSLHDNVRKVVVPLMTSFILE